MLTALDGGQAHAARQIVAINPLPGGRLIALPATRRHRVDAAVRARDWPTSYLPGAGQRRHLALFAGSCQGALALAYESPGT